MQGFDGLRRKRPLSFGFRQETVACSRRKGCLRSAAPQESWVLEKAGAQIQAIGGREQHRNEQQSADKQCNLEYSDFERWVN
jgi:hypothetical protein